MDATNPRLQQLPAGPAGWRPLRPSTSSFLPVRQLRMHLRRWGTPVPGQAPLLLLHGWMDVGASWQFTVDCLRAGRELLAPDWRGFGLTEGPPADHVVFDDYLADLDALLDRLAPGRPVDLVGHSMGGNIAMLYAGARPERVARLVTLESFGMPDVPADEAPARHARWLDEVAALGRGERRLADYPSRAAVAARLCRTNPRLDPERAFWLAGEWARPESPPGGGAERWRLRGEEAHRVVSSRIYRADEVLAHHRAIRAPVLAVRADQGFLAAPRADGYTLAEFQRRLACVPDPREAVVEGAGHMLHHDQPAAVAALIDNFLAMPQ